MRKLVVKGEAGCPGGFVDGEDRKGGVAGGVAADGVVGEDAVVSIVHHSDLKCAGGVGMMNEG